MPNEVLYENSPANAECSVSPTRKRTVIHIRSSSPVTITIGAQQGHQGRSPAQCSVVSPIPSTPTNIAPNHQPAQVVQGVPVISRDMVCSEKQVSSLAGCAHCRAHPPQPFKIYSESKPRQPEAIMHCPSCHKDLQPKIKKVRGCLAWYMIFCGLICGVVCAIPCFFTDEFKDQVFSCPNCQYKFYKQKAPLQPHPGTTPMSS